MSGPEFIDPGRFRTELALEEAVLTPDGDGGHEVDWQELATVFALVEPVSARPQFAADRPAVAVTHRITMRFRQDVESGMRLVRNGRVFEVMSVHDSDESRRYLVCAAREAGR